VLRPPASASLDELDARRSDVAFWRPYVEDVLSRHDLPDDGRAPAAGDNPTHPTFVCGDFVVKLFGTTPTWRTSHAAERAAYVLLAQDESIAAPRLVAEGRLFDDADAPWPYLVTSRMRGVAWRDADLSRDDRLRVAAELGGQIRRVHALRPSGVATAKDWPVDDVAPALRRSSLPPRLAAQADAFLARLPRGEDVFVHGDLVATHVFVDDGRLAGIIDWGDAMAADRHYEIIQVHRDLFDCNKTLLRVFLDASGWPVDETFAVRALGHGLLRQAIGIVQHGSMDVFKPIAARFALDDFATLEHLAVAVFSVRP